MNAHAPPPNDRRRSPRTLFVRPCKVRAIGRTGFSPAETTDLSAGGALIRVDRNRHLKVDDWIDVAVAWDRQPLLASDDAIRARIRRVVPIDHHSQAIGVEFHQAMETSLAAAA
jgi:c-di-GMP-binding flagellar brake protein YcgR